MVSYIKTQWWKVLISVFCLLVVMHFLAQPAPDESTLEGVKLTLQYMINAVSWLVSGLIWAVMSFVNWHEDCIRELDKRLKRVEEHAITDLDPKGNGNYIARRRCGPDKDVPFPKDAPTIEERIKKTDKMYHIMKTTQEAFGYRPSASETITVTGKQLEEYALRLMEDKEND